MVTRWSTTFDGVLCPPLCPTRPRRLSTLWTRIRESSTVGRWTPAPSSSLLWWSSQALPSSSSLPFSRPGGSRRTEPRCAAHPSCPRPLVCKLCADRPALSVRVPDLGRLSARFRRRTPSSNPVAVAVAVDSWLVTRSRLSFQLHDPLMRPEGARPLLLVAGGDQDEKSVEPLVFYVAPRMEEVRCACTEVLHERLPHVAPCVVPPEPEHRRPTWVDVAGAEWACQHRSIIACCPASEPEQKTTPVGGSLVRVVGQCQRVLFPVVLPSVSAGRDRRRRSRTMAFADFLLTRGVLGPTARRGVSTAELPIFRSRQPDLCLLAS